MDNVYVITSYRKKNITVKVRVKNSSQERKNVLLSNFILDNGKILKTLPEKKIYLNPGEIREIEISQKWSDAHLWSHEDPYLYHLRTEIHSKNKVIDTVQTRFGFREFWVEKDSFYLNGIKVHLLGEGTMQSYPTITRRFVKAWIKMLKDSNHNCVRFHMGDCPDWVWDVCDEEGILAVSQSSFFQLVHNDADNPIFWKNMAKEIQEWVEKNRNHPSIIMWNADNEIHHLEYSIRLKKLIQKYDKTRPIEYGGDSCYNATQPFFLGNRDYYDSKEIEVLSTYFYPCYGYPGGGKGKSYGFQDLLIREKHPPVWQKLADKPIVIDEFSFPYDLADITELRNKDRKGHVAWLVGDKAYLEEENKKDTRMITKVVKLGKNRPNLTFFSPAYIEARAIIAKDLLSIWRCYDLAGILHFEGFLCTAGHLYDFSNIKMSYSSEEISSPGIKPDRLMYKGILNVWDKQLPSYRPNELFYTVKESFSPVFIYLAGDKDITDKKHIYFTGEKIEKSLFLVNDTLKEKVFDVHLCFEDNSGRIYQTINKSIKVLPGEVKRKKVSFITPSFSSKTRCRIEIISMVEGKEYKKTFPITVFTRKDTLKPNCKIGVYGKKLFSLLKKNINPISLINDLKNLKDYDILFGNGSRWLLLNIKEVEEFVRKGGIIVCLSNEPSFVPISMKTEKFTVKNLFLRSQGHPLLESIEEDDLFKIEINKLPMWKKPTRGSFRVLIDGGYRLDYTPFIETFIGKGEIIYLSLPIENYGKEPVITTLINNCIHYRESIIPETVEISYLGGKDGEELLNSFGIDYKKIGKINKKNRNTILIVGKDITEDSQIAEITSFVKRGGKCIFLKREKFKGFPFDLGVKKVKTSSLKFFCSFPQMRGINNGDLYWNKKIELSVFNNFPTFAFSTPPAAILSIDYGKGNFLFLQLDKRDILLIGERAERVISTIFTNLGIK